MKKLIEIFQKMEKRSQIKFVIIAVLIILFIAGTVTLVVSDQKKAREKQIALYQQQFMERLLRQQAEQQGGEYTEKDFKEAKKNLPPVEEIDFDPKQ